MTKLTTEEEEERENFGEITRIQLSHSSNLCPNIQ